MLPMPVTVKVSSPLPPCRPVKSEKSAPLRVPVLSAVMAQLLLPSGPIRVSPPLAPPCRLMPPPPARVPPRVRVSAPLPSLSTLMLTLCVPASTAPTAILPVAESVIAPSLPPALLSRPPALMAAPLMTMAPPLVAMVSPLFMMKPPLPSLSLSAVMVMDAELSVGSARRLSARSLRVISLVASRMMLALLARPSRASSPMSKVPAPTVASDRSGSAPSSACAPSAWS